MFAFTTILATLVALGSSLTIDDCPLNLARDQYLQVYGDTCYQFFLDYKRDYNSAEEYCENHGGTLVMVKSQDIEDYLLYQILQTYHYTGDYDVWIGLNDKVQEGTFMWEDGTFLGSYSNWASSDGPNHHEILVSTAGQDDCVAMNTHDGGLWHDYHCSSQASLLLILSFTDHSVEHPFICQYKATPRPTSPSLVTVTVHLVIGNAPTPSPTSK